MISVCNALGIEAQTSCDTGVWIGDNKIAAIGTTSTDLHLVLTKHAITFFSYSGQA